MDDFGGVLLILIFIALALFLIVSMWKVFVKAGQPGWGIFIPIYNIYLYLCYRIRRSDLPGSVA